MFARRALSSLSRSLHPPAGCCGPWWCPASTSAWPWPSCCSCSCWDSACGCRVAASPAALRTTFRRWLSSTRTATREAAGSGCSGAPWGPSWTGRRIYDRSRALLSLFAQLDTWANKCQVSVTRLSTWPSWSTVCLRSTFQSQPIILFLDLSNVDLFIFSENSLHIFCLSHGEHLSFSFQTLLHVLNWCQFWTLTWPVLL